jgi:hypothetical protein
MAFPKITRRKIFTFFGGSSILAALITTSVKHHKGTPPGILFSDPQIKLLVAAGQQRAGAYLLFYLTGTTTPANVYADGLLTMPLSQVPGAAQPSCTANSAGRFNPIYMDPAITYRVQMYTAEGVNLEDTDPYVPHGIANQGTLGALLNPQTDAEIYAGVKPTNYLYPPGNILRYDAKVDGATDDTAAINQAIAVCNAGQYTLTGPSSGTTIVSSALTTLTSFGGVDFNVGAMKISPIGTGYTVLEMGGAPKVINIDIEGTGNAVNGLYLNTVIRVASSNIRINNLAGQGLKIAACFDCQFNFISVELCGTSLLYAFSMTDGSNECDESWFGHIQVERSGARAMFISPKTLNCAFGVIHSEQSNGNGTSPTHIFGGSYCHFAAIRMEANSNIIVSLQLVGSFIGSLKAAGATVLLAGGNVGSFAPTEVHQLLSQELQFTAGNVSPWKIIAGAVTDTVTANFGLVGQVRLEDCRLTNISLSNNGTIMDLLNCSVSGTIVSAAGNPALIARQCQLTNFPSMNATLRECTVTKAYTTVFGQQIDATQCTFNGTITIGNSSVKWKSDRCNFAAGVTLGAGSPGWAFGPNDYVSGGAVSAGFNAPPTGGSWVVGERGYNIQPIVGQPKSRVCTVAGTPGTHTSEGNL